MKINGFQVEEHGEGFAVTLRVHVGLKELPEMFIDEPIRAVVQLLAGLPNMMEGFDVRSNTGGAQDAADPKPARKRSRRGNRDDAVAGKGDTASGGAKEPHAAADADGDGAPAGRRRRRSRAAPEAGEAPAGKVRRRRKAGEEKPNADPSTGAPAAGGRGRGRKKPAPAAAKTSPSEDPTGTARRRAKSSAEAADGSKAKPGRRASKTKAGGASSPSEEVSDEDLTRSASLAAAEIGSPAVMNVLDEFGVTQVRDLTPEQRLEFVSRLTEEREASA